jgi:hypothetical protein
VELEQFPCCKQLRRLEMSSKENHDFVIKFRYIIKIRGKQWFSERVQFPHHQIECRITFQNSKPRLNNSLSELLNGNMLGYLSIKNYSLEAIPSCASLHTLVLRECENLKEMGDYKQLRTLKLINCARLTTVGSIPILFYLVTTALPSMLLLAFPLENLSHLAVLGWSSVVLMNLSRFINLSSLGLAETVSEHVFLPKRSELPNLGQLLLLGFREIDISNLMKLKHLNMGSCQVVVGKEKIYPRLESLHGAGGAFEEDDICLFKNLKLFVYNHMSLFARTNNLHQYGNISDISLGDYNPGDAPGLTVGNKVTSCHLASNKDIIIEMEAKRNLSFITFAV